MAQASGVGFGQTVHVWADDAPAAALLCGICYDAFHEALSLPCGHTFCGGCLTAALATRRSCPSCRAPVAAIAVPAPNWPVRELVSQLRVHCCGGIALHDGVWAAADGGCPDIVTAGSKAAHEAACPFAFVLCPFAGCGQALRRRDVDAHEAANARAHAAGELAARLGREQAGARAAAAPPPAPGYALPPGYRQMLLFELFGESPEAATPAAASWRAFRALPFCTAWAAQCTADGLRVEPLLRAEGGVCTPGLHQQIRFHVAETITGEKWDIQTTSRYEAGAPPWTVAELLILKNSFVKAMERSMGSLDSAGAHIDGTPSTRSRLLFAYN
jgi:hypothetical protein